MPHPKPHRPTNNTAENDFEAHLVSNLLTTLAKARLLDPADYQIAPNETPEKQHEPARPMDGLRSIIAKAVKAAVKDLETSTPSSDPAIQRLTDVIVRALPNARRMASESTIEKMVEALIETQDPVAQASAAIDADNARARLRFINEIHTLTADEIAREIASTARNRHQTASRWKNDGKIFSVTWQGRERYPHFQFKEGRPLPIIAEILKILPARMTPWETAFWFVSTNGWLNGAAPYDHLAEPEPIAKAARHEAEIIAG